MAEDYKGQFKRISKEYGIGIKLIKALDGEGTLGQYLSYLDSMNEDNSRAAQAMRIGADFNKGGSITSKKLKFKKKYGTVDNLKNKKKT